MSDKNLQILHTSYCTIFISNVS